MNEGETRSDGLKESDLESDDDAPIDDVLLRDDANAACMAQWKTGSVCDEGRDVGGCCRDSVFCTC